MQVLVTAITFLCLCQSAFGAWFGFGRTGSDVRYIDILPSLSWSTNAYEFGSKDAGTSTGATFTITNSGNDIAEDVATTVTGVGFRIYSTVTFGNISSGKTRTVKVAFEPTGAGAYSGFANYSAPNIARKQIVLSGTGVTP